jgi:hypothetical protein
MVNQTMKILITKIVLVLLFILPAAGISEQRLALASGQNQQISTGAQDISLMQLEEVSDLIMSPGCNYVYTLSFCPSAEAEQMRELVKDKIAAGETTDEILDYFAEIYGPKVLAQPAKSGFYFAAWWFPFFLIFDVILLVAVMLIIWRKKSGLPEDAPDHAGSGAEPPDQELTELLEKEVRQFRQK